MISQEIFDQQAKELASVEAIQLALPPDHGYMLATVVQAAAMCLDFPETTQNFCKTFVQSFCDRYRDQMPTVINAIEVAWDTPLVTEDEFNQSLTDDWIQIITRVEHDTGCEIEMFGGDDDDDLEDRCASGFTN